MAETSREIGRLGISRAAVQKQRERRRKTRKLRGDIRREEPEPLKIDELCSYFDLINGPSSPYRLVKSFWGDAYDIQLYGRLGLCCYNFEQGTNLKFVRWEKYNTTLTAYTNFYVTLEAMDPASQRILPFQTMVSDFGYGKGIIKWRSLASRLKCNETVDNYWDETEEIDAFYKGAMPKWLFHVDADNKKYYVVQESELLENDWLNLFAEIALYSKSDRNLDAPPLLELKNVVIETKEEYTTEAREKLKADNAIFYISFKCNGDLSTGWGAGDHNAIIRKTMDGSPGHICLLKLHVQLKKNYSLLIINRYIFETFIMLYVFYVICFAL